MDKNRNRCSRIALVFIVCMLVSVLAFLVLWLLNPSGDQLRLFFIQTEAFFSDYFNVCEFSANLNPYCYGEVDSIPWEHAYPPINYVIFYLLSRFANYVELGAFEASCTTVGLLTAFLFITACILLFYECLRRAYGKSGAFGFLVPACIMCSSIFLFSVERANIILLSAAAMMFFVLCYRNDNKLIREVALLSLAFATALKGYPALMGILLLRDNQFVSAIRCAIYAVILIFVPFLFFEGGFANIPTWIHNIGLNSEIYNANMPAFGFGVVFRRLAHLLSIENLASPLITIPNLICKILCVIGLIASIWQDSEWKRVLLLGCVIVCLQTNSAEYLGLYLLIGICFFLRDAKGSKADWVYLALVLLLLIPVQVNIGWNATLTFVMMGLSCDALLVMLTAEAVLTCARKLNARKEMSAE